MSDQPKLPRGGGPVSGHTRTLDLLGRLWTVVFEKGVLYIDDKEVQGSCEEHKQALRISGKLCREAQRSTLLHEIRHAFDIMIHGEHPSDEELCVRTTEMGMYHFLRAPINKWALAFIQEDS